MTEYSALTERPALRFWKYTYITDYGCILWLGARSEDGYGQFKWRGPVGGMEIGRRQWAAHRWSWAYFYGAIPDGMVTRHRCDTPGCVNPEHLELGTILDNNRDTVERGRHCWVKKTHCKHGHEMTPENAYIDPVRGWRRCKLCRRPKVRAYRDKNKVAINAARRVRRKAV